MLNFGSLAFASPWLLLGLLSLPVIWWLLRIMPPAPRRVLFPPIRILRELTQTEETPAATPLWLTILRMVLAALVVLALAQPLLNPRAAFDGGGPLLIVIDDGWAAAPGWKARQEVLSDLLDQAERQEQPVLLLPTAPRTGDEPVTVSRMMRAGDARPIVQALQPKPWPADRAAALAALRTLKLDAPAQVVWLSDGIDDGHAQALARQLADIGELTLYQEDGLALAKALLPPEIAGTGLRTRVLRAAAGPAETVWVRASGEGGRLLDRTAVTFGQGERRVEAVFDIPSEVRNEIERLDIEGETSAGAVVLMDERWRRRPVGLISGADLEERAQPLLSSLYYLDRALAPFSDVRTGDLHALLERPLAVMMLADIGQLPEDEAADLEQWVEQGGMLVRFAGPRLAQNADRLIPVRLRSGGRMLGGAMSWEQPARLAPFPENSPFRSLELPNDVLVHRQVLAEPSLDLNKKTWARLTDGTPLVTAERRGEGWLVLFHTTANTEWSNLPLSGLFVEMLHRTTSLARGIVGEDDTAMLPPHSSLDGLGRLGPAAANAQPVAANAIATTHASAAHPPGYYGRDEARRALNLTAGMRDLSAIADLGAPARRLSYVAAGEVDLKPWLLFAAVLLGLIDLLAALTLRGLLRIRPRPATAALLLAGVLLAPSPKPAFAQSDDAFALMATLETRLAYVVTGDSEVDTMSQAGLSGLSEVLRRRTSVEPGEPMAVDIERDELVFFPLIYWPITTAQPELSNAAIARLDSYMRTGGMILFDTRDAQTATPGLHRGGANSENAQHLRKLLQRLDIPPLAPIPEDHVLTKSFYLMQSFPGRYDGGPVWVEARPDGGNDGVSSIVIGGNDWAAAWAMDENGRPIAAVVPGGDRQREMAYRFGVNLVMYTLTGNYKADQVHVPAILERLGQ